MSDLSNWQKKWVKTLKFIVAYLVAAWTFLQFVDWILTRYQISPYWVDILLWFFIGIIPSLLIYFYHQERINKRILLLREKIIFPTNITLLAVGLYFGFGTSDLGATTKEVKYIDTEGHIAETTITKEEFRTIIPIYNFTSKTSDSSLTWMSRGITGLLFYDLLQDKSLSPDWSYADNTTDKVMEAKLISSFYVDGSYEKIDDNYTIITTIRKSKTGKLEATKTFKGTDFLDLIDEISIYIKGKVSVATENSLQHIDLNVKDFISNSLPALEDYFNGDYENAISKDSTFALAYLQNSRRNLRYSQGKHDEQALAEKAYELRNKLPYDFQMEAMALRYLSYDKFEEAKELVNMQLEVSPQNIFLNNILYGIYGETKNVNDYYTTTEKRFNASKSNFNLMAFGSAVLAKGEYEQYIDMVNLYSKISPNNNYIFPYKLVPQILSGKINDAKDTFKKLNIVHPDFKNLNQVYEKPIEYQAKNKIDSELLKFFEGEFKSEGNEAIQTIWVEKNKLLGYYSNQRIQAYIPSSKYTFIGGLPNQKTFEYEYKQNKDGVVYAHVRKENFTENSYSYWMWKLDDSIKKAENYLVNADYENAEEAYKKAIDANPKHYYLKNVLQHITYVKEKDTFQLAQQYQKILGTYSKKENENKRSIYLKEGKLIYKRDGLPSKELLPISENRYMTLSSYKNHYEFVLEDEEAIASFAWVYNADKEEWEDYNPDSNYLLKEK
ncbi:hypothetical protein [uncultured Croceitalea sp.]|uniref:tetratricopeptide repeat protein n=1 Tax=uncultured Croceitalea sp. TaxID=1798908 RepID=UPI00374F8C64